MVMNEVSLNARIDAAEVGFTATVPDFYEKGFSDWAEVLAKVAKISTPKTKASDGFEQITFTLHTEVGHEAGLLRIYLHARQEGDDLIFGNRSKIQLNGMIMLRADLDPDTCGPSAIDGKFNLVGSQHRGTALTMQQLPLLGQAVENALIGLNNAYPHLEPGRIWLKRAEACRDLTIPNAVVATRILQQATLYGAIRRQLDSYRRVGCLEDEGTPSLSFFTQVESPVSKIYLKRPDTLRLEIACTDRKQVMLLLDEAQSTEDGGKNEGIVKDRVAEWSPSGAERLFLDLLHAATPRLDHLEAHTDAALASEVSIGQLLSAMISLLGRAAGQQKRKGPPSLEAQAIAIEAVEALLLVGMFDCAGAHSRTAIRKDLDGLSTKEGPLSKHPNRTIYYLKPEFARACGQMRGIRND